MCCFKKSAVTEIDPYGGVEKHPTRTCYEINMFFYEEEVFLCCPGPFWIYRILTDYDKLHCCDIRITGIYLSVQPDYSIVTFCFFSHMLLTSNLLHYSPSIVLKITESKHE